MTKLKSLHIKEDNVKVKILSLLPASFKKPSPVMKLRILPLMKKLRERGHEIKFQENLAMEDASPGEYLYLLARLKYFSRFLLQSPDGYDLIFASKPAMGVLAYLLSRKLSIPFALDIDDLEGIGGLDTHKYGTSMLIRKANKVFVASRQLYELYLKIRNDIVYLPNTTDLMYFNPKKYGNIEEFDEPTFIWASGIGDNPTTFNLVITSLSKLREGTLCIIGKLHDNQKKYCLKLSRKLGVEKRVMLKGWVPNEEVPRLYKASHIGLLPFNDTLWTRCKCPSRLFEFMAMELPFICTVGEPAHMAKKVGCGVIAKPNIEDFTDKMKYAVDHLEDMKRKAKQGRTYLLKSQNLDLIAEKLEKGLQTTLK